MKLKVWAIRLILIKSIQFRAHEVCTRLSGETDCQGISMTLIGPASRRALALRGWLDPKWSSAEGTEFTIPLRSWEPIGGRRARDSSQLEASARQTEA